MENSFWNAITEDTSSNSIKDGTSWFLECRLPNKYHCINRSSDDDFLVFRCPEYYYKGNGQCESFFIY